jgi:hypothetical protein
MDFSILLWWHGNWPILEVWTANWKFTFGWPWLGSIARTSISPWFDSR